MRIAFFLNRFPALSQTFVLNQITSTIDAGHDVTIFARRLRNESQHHAEVDHYALREKVRVLRRTSASRLTKCLDLCCLVVNREIWKRRKSLLSALFDVHGKRQRFDLNFLREALVVASCGDFDIIHCQFGKLAPSALRLRKLGIVNGKLVTSFRGYDVTKVLRQQPDYYADLFKEGSLFLPVSVSLKETLLAAGCPPERTIVLHSGINCERFRYRRRAAPGRRTVRLISVGRLVEKKGFAGAIEAFARVLKAGEDVEYSLVGDGKLRENLRRRVRALGVDEKVHFLGWRDHDQVSRLLAKSDILIAPSLTDVGGSVEGIPNAMKEAMATRLPVLGTRHGGIPELVEDGVSGYLVAEGDVDALTRRLHHLCAHPGEWVAMGENGRRKVLSEFDAIKLNAKLMTLYENLVSATA